MCFQMRIYANNVGSACHRYSPSSTRTAPTSSRSMKPERIRSRAGGVRFSPDQYTAGAVEGCGDRRGGASGYQCRRPCPGRTGDPLCGRGRCRVHRPRHPAQRPDHAADEARSISPAVPTFVISNISPIMPPSPGKAGAREHAMLDYKIRRNSRSRSRQDFLFAVGWDVGPFPHGTQAREFELMVKYGMTPLAVLQADYLNGALDPARGAARRRN